MKNTMKKFVGVIMILAIMMSVGVAAHAAYETEEVPTELIMELVKEGFRVSEEDEDIWTIEMIELDEEGVYNYGQGWFNIVDNYGLVFAFTMEKNTITESTSDILKWNTETNEIDCISEYEMIRF